MADFTGDGRPDLAIAVNVSRPGPIPISFDNISVVPGDGAGGFGDPILTAIGIGGLTRSLWLGDFNGDGKHDLLTGPTPPMVLLGDGAGHFLTPIELSQLPNTQAAAVADFNGDGNSDLAVAYQLTEPGGTTIDRVTVLLSDGQGGFSNPVTQPVAGHARGVATADFNTDGRLDLAIAAYGNFGASAVAILLGDGAGAFGPPSFSPVTTGTFAQSVAVADFNADGRPDVIIETTREPPSTGFAPALSVLLGSVNGGFTPSTNFRVADGNVTPVTADFNADGKLDLAFSDRVFLAPDSWRVHGFSVMLGDGSGSFGPRTAFVRGPGPVVGFAVGDLNGDERPDLARSDWSLANLCGTSADLAISLTDAPDPDTVGSDLAYTITATNNGPAPAGFVTTRVVVPPGVDFVQSFPSDACSPPVQPLPPDRTVRCDVPLLTPSGGDNSATFTILVRPIDVGSPRATVIVASSQPDPNPANNTAAQATTVRNVGAFALGVAAAPGGGAQLSWTDGALEAGYLVGRMAGDTTTVLPAPDAPLPATATGFTDPSPIPGALNCYAVVPVDAGGMALGRSDLLCLLPSSASAANVPTKFTLRLNQGNAARLTWNFTNIPGQTGYALRWLTDAGPPPDLIGLGKLSTFTTHDTGGDATCYVLAVLDDSVVLGHTDLLCGMPGFAAFGPPSDGAVGSKIAAALTPIREQVRALEVGFSRIRREVSPR
jgi:uncharacterized repeat protein (TIGR01451 family)